MRCLFEMDLQNYAPDTPRFVRPSVRGILIRDGRIAMVHSLKYDYYKFPGGGLESGETHLEALIREVREEAGLKVIASTVRPYGLVHRVEMGAKGDVLVQDNFYYLCEAEPEMAVQELDDYEAEERFTLEFVRPQQAIQANREQEHGHKSPVMIEREARVLEMLVTEGYFASPSSSRT